MKHIVSVMPLILFLTSLAPVYSATKPQDVYGWQNLRWGMNSKEVLNILVRKVEERNIRKDEKENMYSMFQIRGVKIAAREFRASLWMNSESHKLTRIVFVPEKEPFLFDWAETFIDLEHFLKTKYGDPDIESTSNDPGTSADRIWKFPSTEIELTYLKLEDSELLLLVYSNTDRTG